jgi:uncharacterized protein (TIGR00661 family)
VRVIRIPGIRFHYKQGRLSLTRSVTQGLRFKRRLRGIAKSLAGAIRHERPNLVITDFEPTLPRAAELCQVPYVSLDHQYFLVAYDLSALPLTLRAAARVMRPFVRAYYRKQCASIVSSFFSPPCRRGQEKTISVGPLLRPELIAASRHTGRHIVSYLRPHTPPRVLELLAAQKREVRVYGLGHRRPEGPLRFCPFDEHRFVTDLANCYAVIGAAGNQSIGEALFLGKPILALPERHHHEQRINAWFLADLGAGQWSTLESFDRATLRNFFRNVDACREQARALRSQMNGNEKTIGFLQRYLPQASPGNALRNRLNQTSSPIPAEA